MNRAPGSTLQTPRRLRCAIYTRKSSEEGLDMEFNSLDAQREVALPAETTRPRMARMLTRFVLQLQEARVEGGTQALLDARADRAQA